MGFVLSEDSIGCPDLGIDLFEVECDPSQRWLLEFHCVFHGTQTVDSILLSDKRRIVTSGIESSFKSTQTMNICINELCRTAGFDFIDFENSFVYGTYTATKETISTEADFSSSGNFLIDLSMRNISCVCVKSIKVPYFGSFSWARFIKCKCLVLANEFG